MAVTTTPNGATNQESNPMSTVLSVAKTTTVKPNAIHVRAVSVPHNNMTPISMVHQTGASPNEVNRTGSTCRPVANDAAACPAQGIRQNAPHTQNTISSPKENNSAVATTVADIKAASNTPNTLIMGHHPTLPTVC